MVRQIVLSVVVIGLLTIVVVAVGTAILLELRVPIAAWGTWLIWLTAVVCSVGITLKYYRES